MTMTAEKPKRPVKKRVVKEHPYYSFLRILSFNAIYMFIVGGRGLGKTYGAKEKVIKDYLKHGAHFVYLRRYKTEMNASKSTFFADIAHAFPDYIFRVVGNEAQIARANVAKGEKNAWTTFGFFVTLSTGQSQKGKSFHLVRTIIFDEFIIEKGLVQYLPDETTVFNNFYSTVDRWQDKTRVFFLANSVSIMNPYFLKYGIEPDKADEGGFIRKAGGFIAVHFPDSKLFAMSVFQTAFGKFIAATDEEYADYAVSNTFNDNNDNLLAPKDPKSRYRYTIETKAGSFSVWYNLFTREYTIQEKLPKKETVFTLVPEKMGENKTLLVYGDKLMQQLRAAFRSARITFDNPTTRNVFIEVFKR